MSDYSETESVGNLIESEIESESETEDSPKINITNPKKVEIVDVDNDFADPDFIADDSEEDSSFSGISDLDDDRNDDDATKAKPVIARKKRDVQKQMVMDDSDEDTESDEDDDEKYLKKFSNESTANYVNLYHPECNSVSNEEVQKLAMVIRNDKNEIIDDLHKTCPFLTKYERTEIVGQRAKQILNGSLPFIELPSDIIDPIIIAEMELTEKKLPFIIKRPLFGKFEYWHLKDLEQIN